MDRGSGTKLVIIFLIILLIKLFFIPFIQSPSAVNDGYVFSKMAQSFFYTAEFATHGVPASQYTPLYPIILSISFLGENMPLIYFFMKLTNAILASLIVFPAFLLAREFMKERKALFTSLIVGFLPSHFIMSNFLLSENLFYPLFLLTFYIAYLSFKKNSFKNFLFLGILTGLSFLARPTAIAFIPVFVIMFLFQIIKKEFKFKNFLILLVSSSIIILPWFIRNGSQFGWTITGLLGRTYITDVSSKSALSVFSSLISIDWMLIYGGVLVIAGLLIFPVFSLLFIKRLGWKNPLPWLFILTILSFLFIAASHGSSTSPETPGTILGRLAHTRHIDQLIPLVVIFGIAGLERKKLRKKELLLTLTLTITAVISLTQLILGSQRLFPPNNGSLLAFGAFFEVLNLILSNIILSLLFTLLVLTILFSILLRLRSIFPYLFLIFIIITSIIGSTLIAYNTNAWANTDHKELGIWLEKRTSPNTLVVYDKESCVELIQKSDQSGLCEKGGLFIPSAFWINSKVTIDDEDNADYFVTIRDLKHKTPIKEFNNFRVYTFFNGEI